MLQLQQCAVWVNCWQFAAQLLPTLGNKQQPTDTTATPPSRTRWCFTVQHSRNTQQHLQCHKLTQCPQKQRWCSGPLDCGVLELSCWRALVVNVHSNVHLADKETKLDLQSEWIKVHRSQQVKLDFPINTTIYSSLWLSETGTQDEQREKFGCAPSRNGI